MQTEVSSQCSSSSTHSPVGGQLAADSAGPAGTVGRPAGVLIEAFESSANKECPIRETADCNTNSSIIGSVVPRRSRWGPKSTQLTADRSAPLRTRRCTRGGGIQKHPSSSNLALVQRVVSRTPHTPQSQRLQTRHSAANRKYNVRLSCSLPAKSILRSSVRCDSMTTKQVRFSDDVDNLRRTIRNDPDRCIGLCFRREHGTNCKLCIGRRAGKSRECRWVSPDPAPPKDVAFAMSHARMRAIWLASITGLSPTAATIVPVVSIGPHVCIFDYRQAFPQHHDDDDPWPSAYKSRRRNPTYCATRNQFRALINSDKHIVYEDRSASGPDAPYVVRTTNTEPPTTSNAPSNSATLIAKQSAGIKLIMDTGCGDSIISVNDAAAAGHRVRTMPRGSGKVFFGVGSTTVCTQKVAIPLDEFREKIDFWAMGSTPPLSSVGKRCTEQGFSFVWPAGGKPYFVAPWGNTIPLVVEDNIPYLHVGSPECAPIPTTQQHLHIPQPQSTTIAVAESCSSSVATKSSCEQSVVHPAACDDSSASSVQSGAETVREKPDETSNDVTVSAGPAGTDGSSHNSHCDAGGKVTISAGPAGTDNSSHTSLHSLCHDGVHISPGRWRKIGVTTSTTSSSSTSRSPSPNCRSDTASHLSKSQHELKHSTAHHPESLIVASSSVDCDSDSTVGMDSLNSVHAVDREAHLRSSGSASFSTSTRRRGLQQFDNNEKGSSSAVCSEIVDSASLAHKPEIVSAGPAGTDTTTHRTEELAHRMFVDEDDGCSLDNDRLRIDSCLPGNQQSLQSYANVDFLGTSCSDSLIDTADSPATESLAHSEKPCDASLRVQCPTCGVPCSSCATVLFRDVAAPAPKRDLKMEATQYQHLLTHKPANRYCDSCWRAKCRHPPHFKGAFRREPKEWGDIITCDHMVQSDESWNIGCDGSKDILVVKDLATGFKGVFPMPSKSGDNTTKALGLFVGHGNTAKLCYSDNSPEIADACLRLGIPQETSEPGVPQNNGIIERANGDILAMTRTALLHAGLPNFCWPFAARCVCHNDNCAYGEGSASAWYNTYHRGEFSGRLLPFGCAVWFMPSSTKSKRGQPASQARPKWGSRTELGIFAGYTLTSSGSWTGRYLVWSLDLFTGMDLTATGDGRSQRARDLRSPHDTTRIDTCSLGIQFPLKHMYEWWNSTLEGKLHRSGEPGPVVEPPTLSTDVFGEPPELDPATAEPKSAEAVSSGSGGASDSSGLGVQSVAPADRPSSSHQQSTVPDVVQSPVLQQPIAPDHSVPIVGNDAADVVVDIAPQIVPSTAYQDVADAAQSPEVQPDSVLQSASHQQIAISAGPAGTDSGQQETVDTATPSDTSVNRVPRSTTSSSEDSAAQIVPPPNIAVEPVPQSVDAPVVVPLAPDGGRLPPWDPRRWPVIPVPAEQRILPTIASEGADVFRHCRITPVFDATGNPQEGTAYFRGDVLKVKDDGKEYSCDEERYHVTKKAIIRPPSHSSTSWAQVPGHRRQHAWHKFWTGEEKAIAHVPSDQPGQPASSRQVAISAGPAGTDGNQQTAPPTSTHLASTPSAASRPTPTDGYAADGDQCNVCASCGVSAKHSLRNSMPIRNQECDSPGPESVYSSPRVYSSSSQNSHKVASVRASSLSSSADDKRSGVPSEGLFVELPADGVARLRAALDTVKWPSSPREYVPGQGFCIGATQSYQGAYISMPRNEQEDCVEQVNQLIGGLGFPGFHWSSLQFNCNTVSKPHRDANNLGLSLIIILGDYKGGSFHADDRGIHTRSGDPATAVFIQGQHVHRSDEFEGQRYSIVAFMHKAFYDLQPRARSVLGDYCFQVPVIEPALSAVPHQHVTSEVAAEIRASLDSAGTAGVVDNSRMPQSDVLPQSRATSSESSAPSHPIALDSPISVSPKSAHRNPSPRVNAFGEPACSYDSAGSAGTVSHSTRNTAYKCGGDKDASWSSDASSTAIDASVTICALPNATSDEHRSFDRTEFFAEAVDAEQMVLDSLGARARSTSPVSPRMPLVGDSTAYSCVALHDEWSHLVNNYESLLFSPPSAHRPKLDSSLPFFSCVARSVGRREIETTPAARVAMADEWSKLEKNGVFNMASVREWEDVRAEAKANGHTIHHGSLATIVVEKNAELDASDPTRKFKARTVFLGDQVRDQDAQSAIFVELSSAPAAMEAGRACDFYGCVAGHKLTTADGVQAYVQAKLKGPLTWVEIPRQHWPAEWKRRGFQRPVVVLLKALYGHPNAGAYWENECSERVQALGYKPIPEWPSVFWHPVRRLMLIVYVDDFKLAGPAEEHDGAWRDIQSVIDTTPPTGVSHFLGCNQRQGTVEHPDGTQVSTMEYDMSEFLGSCVESYVRLSGIDASSLRSVSTPYLADESGSGPARLPKQDGGFIECEYCKHTFPHPPVQGGGVQERSADQVNDDVAPACVSVPPSRCPVLPLTLGSRGQGRDRSRCSSSQQYTIECSAGPASTATDGCAMQCSTTHTSTHSPTDSFDFCLSSAAQSTAHHPSPSAQGGTKSIGTSTNFEQEYCDRVAFDLESSCIACSRTSLDASRMHMSTSKTPNAYMPVLCGSYCLPCCTNIDCDPSCCANVVGDSLCHSDVDCDLSCCADVANDAEHKSPLEIGMAPTAVATSRSSAPNASDSGTVSCNSCDLLDGGQPLAGSVSADCSSLQRSDSVSQHSPGSGHRVSDSAGAAGTVGAPIKPKTAEKSGALIVLDSENVDSQVHDVAVCPQCCYEIAVTSFVSVAGPSVDFVDERGVTVSGRTRTKKEPKPAIKSVQYDSNDTSESGQLQPIAARILMKVLYAARMCRFDLLRAVCVLAQRVTKWDATCDRRLHRLMAFIKSSLGKRLVGYVGDTTDTLQPHLYCDADLAGCSVTQRSTSGVYHCIGGLHTRFPIATLSKRQSCVSHSTPESELVALDTGLRTIGVPTSYLWEVLLSSSRVVVHEDNETAMRVIRTGKNQTMRHLSRSHGIHIAWMHEMHEKGFFSLVYEPSSSMAADIFTKAITAPLLWDHACRLVGICDTDAIGRLVADGAQPTPPLQGGSSQKLGGWDHKEDGSGTWTRTDHNQTRFRPLLKAGPSREEVVKRTTYDYHTGEVLEVMSDYNTNKAPCAELPPPTPRSLRTSFAYDSTSSPNAKSSVRVHTESTSNAAARESSAQFGKSSCQPVGCPMAIGSAGSAGTADESAKQCSAESSSVSPVPDQPDSNGATPCIVMPVSLASNRRVHPFNFVEACCGPSSLLTTRFSRTHNCTRITEQDDFGSHLGKNCAKLRLEKPGDVLWVSTPCTGGSRWQRYHKKRARPITQARIAQHKKLHDYLWAAAKEVIRHALSRGCTVFIEWPDTCEYWRDTDIAPFVQKHLPAVSCVSACMVGLRSIGAKTEGELIGKGWRIVCNSVPIARTLSLTCNSSHTHVRLEGDDTKLSENYTEHFAEHVHQTVALYGHSSTK